MDNEQLDQCDNLDMITDEGIADDNNLVEIIAEIDDDEQDSIALMDVDRGEVASSETSQDGQFSAILIEEKSLSSKDDEKSNENSEIKESDENTEKSEVNETNENPENQLETREISKIDDDEFRQDEQTDERFYPKTKRELKSLLELSKEAKLLTNLANRRKTIDNSSPSKPKEKSNGDNKQKNILEPVTIILHPSMTTKKQKSTNFPITAEAELENSESTVKKRKKSWTGVDGAVDESVSRKAGKMMKDVVMLKPNKDMFCWRCHHPTVNIVCETCPRSYHQKCLKQTVTDTEHWQCFECVTILKAENVHTRSTAMKEMTLEHLCSLLKFAVKRMIDCSGSEPFMQPVDEKQFPEYKNYVINPMDLTMLEKNIKNNLYGSTQAFEADAKWILHNSIVFNSYQSRLTAIAKILLRICKQEISEIENCSSCYLNANTKKKTWFVEVCPKPHLLVWAKLKGFPYWPAKVMTITPTGMVDVRFFGAHDKSWVPIKDCLLYSIQDPNSTLKKKNDIMKCVKELNLYVENLKKVYGQVNFAPFKTFLEAADYTKQLQLLIPNYKEPKVKNSKIVEDENKELPKNTINKEVDEEDENGSDDDEEEEFKIISNESENNDDSKLSSDLNDSKDDVEDDNSKEIISKKPPVKIKIIRRSTLKRKRSSDSTPERPLKKIAKITEIIHKDKEKNDNKTKIDDSPSKLRITDELIKKLENITDTDSEKNCENGEKVVESKNVNPIENKQDNVETEKKNDKENETKQSEEKNQIDASKEKKDEKTKQNEKNKENNSKTIEENVAINKMVTLVPIQSILEKKLDSKNNNSKCEELVNLKEISIIKDGKEINKLNTNKLNTINKQNEIINNNNNNNTESIHEPLVTIKVEQDSDIEENDDVQYMEAKRQYLSALNISEKPKTSNSINNNNTSNNSNKTSEIRTRSKTEEKKSNKTIVIIDNVSKIINNVVKKKPTDNEKKDERCGEIYIKPLSKMQAPKHKARKSFPAPNYNNNNNINRRSQPTAVIKKILPNNNNKNTNSPQQKLETLTSTNNLVVLPTLHYTKPNTTNNTITILPQITTNESTSVQNNSSLLPIDVNNENNSNNNNNNNNSNSNLSDNEFSTLKEILPENVSRGINEMLCQPPPRLKPKPVGPLTAVFDSGVPSTAGPVASKINANAQKISDYFRSLLIETIDEVGKTNSPEATIASLRLKIEELNHKHQIEVTEIKRNVTIVLKDIQKSIVEERERIVNETKANCEIEMIKRVEEAKSKQWCANCFKEAQFYCCWNTSYCDYPCQQKHWLKHMSKCSQTANNQSISPISSTSSTTTTTTTNSPHLILANAPKTVTGFPKPQKVYVKKSNTTLKQASSGGHITLVESTPGNFELVGNGPISVNGKILASTSIIEKMKSGNITVTSTSTSARSNNNPKLIIQKPTISLTSKTNNNGSDMNT